MIEFARKIKKLTNKKWTLSAFLKVIQVGIESLERREDIENLTMRLQQVQEDHLELARMVHDYETKLVNLERRAFEAEQHKKRYELAYVGLSKENRWMKEELLAQKRER